MGCVGGLRGGKEGGKGRFASETHSQLTHYNPHIGIGMKSFALMVSYGECSVTAATKTQAEKENTPVVAT